MKNLIFLGKFIDKFWKIFFFFGKFLQAYNKIRINIKFLEIFLWTFSTEIVFINIMKFHKNLSFVTITQTFLKHWNLTIKFLNLTSEEIQYHIKSSSLFPRTFHLVRKFHYNSLVANEQTNGYQFQFLSLCIFPGNSSNIPTNFLQFSLSTAITRK